MIVLKIIAVLIAIYGAVLLMAEMNKYTIATYRYAFFNKKNFIIATIGYILLYVGYQWYIKALAMHEDLLNGQLLLVVGTLFLLYLVWENIMETGWIVGILFSCIQLIIYVGFSTLAVMLIIAAISAANNRNGYYYDDHY